MRRARGGRLGFSLAEVTIVVGALSVMTAVLSPSIGNYVEDARRVKASDDVQVIATSFARYALDATGRPGPEDVGTTADLLVGPGEAPRAGNGGDAAWTVAVDGRRVSPLEDFLAARAMGLRAKESGRRYIAAGWRGTEVRALTPDPWGHRYAINVKALAGGQADTIVLSPGPNGLVETGFRADGLRPGGDDIIAVISGRR